MTKPDCEICANLHAEKGRDPPCDSCSIDLLPENVETVQLYNLVRGQVLLTALGDSIDLNYTSVIEVMKLIGVEDSRDVFLSIVKCFEFERELLLKGKEDGLSDSDSKY